MSKESILEGFPAGFYHGTTYSSKNNKPLQYYLYFPPQFSSKTGPFPLIVFLAGFGERFGSRVDFQVGLGDSIRRKVMAGGGFHFTALFPIAPTVNWETDSEGALETIEILDYVIRRHSIDPNRVYLSGHSAGGAGVWDLASDYPTKWAAIVPVATSNKPRTESAKNIPCWIFHGAADDMVPVQGVRNLVDALRLAGADVRYTEIPGAKHIIWRDVYDIAELYAWLADKKRP